MKKGRPRQAHRRCYRYQKLGGRWVDDCGRGAGGLASGSAWGWAVRRAPPPGLRPRGPYAVIIAQTIFVRNYSIGALFPILDSCLSNFLVSVKCT